jgi:hypothetical protein
MNGVMNKPLLVVFTMAACFCPTSRAQVKSKPDFSGTWVVDKIRSEKTNIPLEDSETSLVIEQHDAEIRMVRKFGEMALQAVYYTDQRGDTHQEPLSRQAIKSKTRWDGDKLVTRYSWKRALIGSLVNVDVVEEWKLSKDGKTLTRKIMTIFPKNAPDRVNAVPVASSNTEVRRVYNRTSP